MLLKLAGMVLVMAGLIDVYLTVLYARSGAGLLSPSLNKGVWHLARSLSPLLGRRRGSLLPFVGPMLLVLNIALWLNLIVAGFGLMVWPELGHSIQASQGETPKDFATALYYSGFNFTTLGTGDITPKTGAYRLLAVTEAAIGFSFFTLVITYFLSVYGAIRRRNTFALLLDCKTGRTGKATEFINRIFLDGTLQRPQNELEQIAAQIADLTETHHFYPVLHYFYFKAPHYALSRIALISMDSVSLLKSLLDKSLHDTAFCIMAVESLWTSGMGMLRMVSANFVSEELIRKHENPSPQILEKWKGNYLTLAHCLKKRGVGIVPDLQSGLDDYIGLRMQWYPTVAAIAQSTGRDLEVLDEG